MMILAGLRVRRHGAYLKRSAFVAERRMAAFCEVAGFMAIILFFFIGLFLVSLLIGFVSR